MLVAREVARAGGLTGLGGDAGYYITTSIMPGMMVGLGRETMVASSRGEKHHPRCFLHTCSYLASSAMARSLIPSLYEKALLNLDLSETNPDVPHFHCRQDS